MDPQFDNEEHPDKPKEAEGEENSSERTEESPGILQEHHSRQVEVQVIQEVEDPVKVVEG